MLYYPDRDFSVIQRNRMRPRPQRGQGWRKGDFKFSKKNFYRVIFFWIYFKIHVISGDIQSRRLHWLSLLSGLGENICNAPWPVRALPVCVNQVSRLSLMDSRKNRGYNSSTDSHTRNQNHPSGSLDRSTFWSDTFPGYPIAPFDDRGCSSKSNNF